MNLNINLKINKLLAVTTSILVIIVLSLGCGGQKQLQDQEELPDYVHKMSNGAVQVDIGEASTGSAYFEEFGSIFYDWDGYKTKFELYALSAKSGISMSSLPNPPLKISPLITPNDGVADFFTAILIDDDTQDLYITLFIDTDWQGLVEGQILIHTIQYDGETLEVVTPVDFFKAIDGLYIHELEFALRDNPPGYNMSPLVGLTNMQGGAVDVLQKAQSLEVIGNDVYVGIVPRLE